MAVKFFFDSKEYFVTYFNFSIIRQIIFDTKSLTSLFFLYIDITKITIIKISLIISKIVLYLTTYLFS